jgi:tRNA A-37 threonylcarbamoyl transferase component Bud32
MAMNEGEASTTDSSASILIRQLESLWAQGQRPDPDALLKAAGITSPLAVAEVLAADQWQRWHAGEGVCVEDYFARHPVVATDPAAALLLVYGEFLVREELGESPSLDAYLASFPQCADGLRHQINFRAAVMDPEQTVIEPVRATGVVGAPLRTPQGMTLGAWEHYELLEEIGRGGMGVVYKARDRKLNRTVALKLILAGQLASPDDVRRFRTEAEAAGGLDHPNIVPIYEVGEHEGQHYFSMKLVEGGSLAEKLKGTPLPPRDAASLVESLAQAMHSVHRQGVIHRDLKPANVLLTSDGAPAITDFGLARKLDDVGQTATGAILGTPSYMAPEQAAGKSKQLGPACDVYALGAILYECLTGRPPFKAATPLDTILQVMNDEPVPPSQLQSKTPRDVETICLKCLQKEPVRRYESAEALADDLQRFVEGRPIVARPVGRMERAAKWVRRNPVIAGMSAVVVLALLGGTAVSTGFGIEAWHQAKRAKDNEANAIAKGKELEIANVALSQSADDLKHSRDELVTTLARSLLRPLATQGGDKPMAETEWKALWDLATNRHALGYRVVEEASREAATSRQLRDRAALVLSTAVGLDEQRRAEVEALLLARLADQALGDEQKADLALAASAWDGLTSSAAVTIGKRFLDALNNAKDPNLLPSLTQRLLGLTDRMSSKDAAATLARTATTLVEITKNTKDPNRLEQAKQGLWLVAPRLAAKDASENAPLLVQAMRETTEPKTLSSLAGALSALSARMEAKEARTIHGRAIAIFVQIIQDDKNVGSLSGLNLFRLTGLMGGLTSVAVHLDAEDAAKAGTSLLQVMKVTKDPQTLSSLARCLSVVTEYAEPKEAHTLSGEAAAIFVRGLKNTKDPNARFWLALGLSLVAPRMEVQDGASTLVGLMKNSTEPSILQSLWQGLSGLSAHMGAEDARQAATLLSQAIKDTNNTTTWSWLVQSLYVVSAHLEAKDAAATLSPVIQNAKDPTGLIWAARRVSEAAARLESKDAAPTAATLLQAMNKTMDPLALNGLARGISELTARMETTEAKSLSAQAAAILVQALKNTKDQLQWFNLTQGLSAVSVRLESKDAVTFNAQAAMLFVQTMEHNKSNAFALSRLIQGLQPVVVYLEAKDAARVATTLVQIRKDTKTAGTLPWLDRCLSALAPRMATKDAAQAATSLLQIIKATRDVPLLRELAKCLPALLLRLEARDAAKLLVEANKVTNDPDVLVSLAGGLPVAAEGMDSSSASQCTASLLQAIQNTKNPVTMSSLVAGLPMLLNRLEPKEMAPSIVQEAILFAQAMGDTNNPSDLNYLSRGLTGLLSPLPRAETPTRAARAASAMSIPAGSSYPLASFALLIPAIEPPPGRLPSQQVVDLLKMPPFVGEARRVLLNQLGNRYRRTFADVWEFVRFAEEQKLGLDLHTPPQRPSPQGREGVRR